MTYYMPTKIYEQEECIAAHAAELAALGKKALLVTGRRSAKLNGAEADVVAALEQEGVRHALFDEVEENPSIETIMKARDFAVKEGCDFFIGIGGGSPMDAAKAISLMAKNSDKGVDFLFGEDPSAQWYPVVAVPTTCGTGSEVTGISVLTIHEQKTKGSIPYRIFPELALLDAKYLKKAPAGVLRNTAMDALCHLSESYINAGANDFSRMCALAGLEAWSRSKAFLEDPTAVPEEETLRNMLKASTLGGMAIAQTGTSLPHGMSYGLTYFMGVAHGRACGQFQAGYLAEADPADAEVVVKTAGFQSIEDLNDFFGKACGVVEIPEETLDAIIGQLVANESKLKSAPFPVDSNVLRRIATYNQ
ncbi:MAG: iron-containing alcohol dehydrogenase [Clostridia bacterium]|nr:iron-containing alcohol dehydrogenase [Clostridia bacterium]